MLAWIVLWLMVLTVITTMVLTSSCLRAAGRLLEWALPYMLYGALVSLTVAGVLVLPALIWAIVCYGALSLMLKYVLKIRHAP